MTSKEDTSCFVIPIQLSHICWLQTNFQAKFSSIYENVACIAKHPYFWIKIFLIKLYLKATVLSRKQ